LLVGIENEKQKIFTGVKPSPTLNFHLLPTPMEYELVIRAKFRPIYVSMQPQHHLIENGNRGRWSDIYYKILSHEGNKFHIYK
jgi:hypothetical protein